MNDSNYQQLQLFTEYSAWNVLLCLLLGGVYAFVLYQKKVPWSPTWNKCLTAIRFVLVSFIAILLLGIFTKQTKSKAEKPRWVFLMDNSKSLAFVQDSSTLQTLKKQSDSLKRLLEEKGSEVDLYTLTDSKSLKSYENTVFTEKKTNLSSKLKQFQQQYENLNLAGVVLFSDGIHNQGIMPNYTTYNYQLYTLGIGDTLPKDDLSIKAIFNNKIAYLGNKFPVAAEISNKGFVGKKANVQLIKGKTVLETQQLHFDKDNDLQQVRFLVNANKKGMQHYKVQIQVLKGEFTVANNRKDCYIDVIDNRQKVLLVADAPHPDIKAIRSVIENNDNYEFDLLIPNLTRTQIKNDYDLIIFYQLPSIKKRHRPLLSKLMKETKALMFVVGKQTDLSTFNQLNTGLTIQSSGKQYDNVLPAFNNNFDKFTFDNDKKQAFEEYSPITVPFGDFNTNGYIETILYQRVGNVSTKKPLLVTGEHNNQKMAILLGEGVWQWRLREYAQNQNQERFDELFGKLIQYLSIKEDKRKFRVYPTANVYNDAEPVQFDVDIYNQIYEKITGQHIELEIIDEQKQKKSYAFTNGTKDFRYQIDNLPQGVYKYTAQSVLGGKKQVASGEFTVKSLQLESLNTQADFTLLRELAHQNNGTFYSYENMDMLSDDLLSQKFINILHAHEEFAELIHQSWLLFILITLACVEWFFRKFKGSY